MFHLFENLQKNMDSCLLNYHPLIPSVETHSKYSLSILANLNVLIDKLGAAEQLHEVFIVSDHHKLEVALVRSVLDHPAREREKVFF